MKVTLRELVQSDIQAFGHYEAAKLRRKRIPFSIYYWLVFGRAPRQWRKA